MVLPTLPVSSSTFLPSFSSKEIKLKNHLDMPQMTKQLINVSQCTHNNNVFLNFHSTVSSVKWKWEQIYSKESSIKVSMNSISSAYQCTLGQIWLILPHQWHIHQSSSNHISPAVMEYPTNISLISIVSKYQCHHTCFFYSSNGLDIHPIILSETFSPCLKKSYLLMHFSYFVMLVPSAKSINYSCFGDKVY